MEDMVKTIAKFDKLYYSHDEIINIYAEALQKETGMPTPALGVVMDFESYNNRPIKVLLPSSTLPAVVKRNN